MRTKPVVLFLCTHNTCRSQIAEGYLRNFAGGGVDVYSAGTDPGRSVHPLAVQVMAEVGIDISEQRPKSVKEYLGRLAVRHLIIVCEETETNCPRVFPGMLDRIFWPLPDPEQFVGSQDSKIKVFRNLRDQIGSLVREWLLETGQGYSE